MFNETVKHQRSNALLSQQSRQSLESRDSVPLASADPMKFSNVIVNCQPYIQPPKKPKKISIDDEVRMQESIIKPPAEPEDNNHFFYENSGSRPPSF